MDFIDTHSHLYDEAFDEDIEAVVERAKAAGVKQCIFPGIDSGCYDKMISLSKKLEGFALPGIGLHPTSIDESYRKELDFVYEKIEQEKFYAIGEIGMDCYWSTEFIDAQRIAFKEQLILAAKKDLPVIIHSRNATEEIFSVMDETLEEIKSFNGVLRGTFHAYSGSYETYLRLAKYGDFYVGIGGVLTYKNAGIASVIEKIPLERIILETDSPWLTPAPYRGKRNESSYVAIIAENIARIKQVPVEEVALVTTNNAKKLFRLD